MERSVEILLVEDNEPDIRLTQEGIKETKIHNNLHVARDGEEAMNFLYKRGNYRDVVTPDLILLDLNLPKKDGREVLLAIRSDPRFRDLSIVIWTTSNHAADKAFCKKNGASSYVTKPHTYAELVKAIQKIVSEWLPLSD